MNNTFFMSLLCITLLALAPACSNHKKEVIKDQDTRITIELDDTIFEIDAEQEQVDLNVVKF